MFGRKVIGPILVSLIVLPVVSGCNRPPSEKVTISLSLVVIPPKGTTASTHIEARDEDLTVITDWGGDEPGRVAAIVKNHRLQVDGVDFGPLTKDDKVIVDMSQGGKVTVNDQERKPVEQSKAEKAGKPAKP